MNWKILFWIALIPVQACIPEMNFESPQLEQPGMELKTNANLSGLINSYLQSEQEILTFDGSEEIIVGVLVVSSDEGGNFYKRLVVQDLSGAEVRGISILIDLRSYFTKYPVGSKLYIKVNGLSLFGENGSFTLGFRNQDRMEPIPEMVLNQFLIRSGVQENLKTSLRQASDLDENDINTRVRLKGVQFEKDDLGKTFAAESYDTYNALRRLKTCSDESSLFMSTSIYSDFKHELLPVSTFEVIGILSREYGDQLSLIINNPDDLVADNSSRCDDEFMECESSYSKENSQVTNHMGKNVLFYENFEGIQSTREISTIGWSNVNVNFGNGKFVRRSSNDNTFIRISAYGTQESTMEVWLVSPEIDLDKTRGEILTFDSRATFNEGRLLSVWISTDYEYDLRQATWYRLYAKVSEGSSHSDNEKFISSGEISLDCIEGAVRIAFRYLGGDPGPSTNYDLDNFLITGSFQ
jgi:hypothetical protein